MTMEIQLRSRWVRVTGPKRERGRQVKVVGVSGPPWNIIEYRYTSSLDGGYGLNQGKIRDRTNTTSMHIKRFRETFSILTAGD